MQSHTNYNMNHKQSMNSWRNFLTEAANKSAAIPPSKTVTIPDAAWPMLRPETAGMGALAGTTLRGARAALGGKNNSDLKPKEIFALHPSLGRAAISLSAQIQIIVGRDKCKDIPGASAVMLSFDLSDPVPGHDGEAQVGFQTQSAFDKFVKLLTSAARTSSVMGTLGQVPAFYTSTDGQYAQVSEEGKITIGVSPVWNHHTQEQDPAVVLAWGDIGEHHGGYGGPYFLHPDGALMMARECLRLAAPLIKRNDGEVYQHPSALPVPPALEDECEKRSERATLPPHRRTKDIKLGGISI